MLPDLSRLLGFDNTGRGTDEQWAEVIAVDWRVGPLAGVRLSIHVLERTPFEVKIRTRVPRGKTLTPGQHVAIRRPGGQHSARKVDNDWVIVWGGEPQYGVPKAQLDAMLRAEEQKTVANALAGASSMQLDALAAKLAAGEISQADYDSTVEYLRTFSSEGG